MWKDLAKPFQTVKRSRNAIQKFVACVEDSNLIGSGKGKKALLFLLH